MFLAALHCKFVLILFSFLESSKETPKILNLRPHSSLRTKPKKKPNNRNRHSIEWNVYLISMAIHRWIVSWCFLSETNRKTNREKIVSQRHTKVTIEINPFFLKISTNEKKKVRYPFSRNALFWLFKFSEQEIVVCQQFASLCLLARFKLFMYSTTLVGDVMFVSLRT